MIREADWVGGNQLWFMELLAQPHALQTLMQFVSLQFDAGTLAQWHDVRAGQPLRARSLRFPRREKVDGSNAITATKSPHAVVDRPAAFSVMWW